MHRRTSIASLLVGCLALGALSGCGGSGGSNAYGEVAGSVFDSEGNPVRDARVYVNGGETRTNSFGSYLVDHAAGGDVTVRAEIRQNGARYFGQNVGRVFEGERTKNVNITVYPESQLATLRGATYDRSGTRLSGVRVFARPVGTGVLSSSQTISDSSGNFKLEGLRGDTDYELLSNAPGYGDDTDTIRLEPGETRDLAITLGNSSNTAFDAPDNVVATAWTSPREVTRDRQQANALEAMKRLLDPKRAKRGVGRDTVGGNPIEVEVVWDRPAGSSLLGFGIYRGTGGQLGNVDFVRDPLAEVYVDSSQELNQGRAYDFGVTTLNTRYPDTEESESVLSNVDRVTPLGDLEALTVSGTKPTFTWRAATGATKYSVFLFTQYPSIGVTPVFDNDASPVTGTSYAYNGAALTRGRTYYYILLGTNDDRSARTLSRVESFVAP